MKKLLMFLFLTGCGSFSEPTDLYNNVKFDEYLHNAIKSVVVEQLRIKQEYFESQKESCKKTSRCLGKPTELSITIFGNLSCVLKNTNRVVDCDL